MALFGKREIVFKTTGDKERWKAVRAALKAADIRIMEAGSLESEEPICSCGAKIDRRVYYVAVRPEDVGRACAVLMAAVGGPLISNELVVPQKHAQKCAV